MFKKNSFTIIELLIVFSILAILVSLLQPSLDSVLENSSRLKCQTNLRQIGLGFSLFASDQDDHLPGTTGGNWEADEMKHSWIGSEVGYRDNDPSKKMRGRERVGSIWPYLGKTKSKTIYRCPSLEEGVWNSGVGSNGLFDYVSFQVFAGAKVHNMPSKAYYPLPVDDSVVNINIDKMDTTIVPLVTEEDPNWWLNRRHIESAHTNLDRMGNWHGNGTNIAAPDGSAQYIEFINRGPYAREWKALAPSGGIVNLSGRGWGEWNSR